MLIVDCLFEPSSGPHLVVLPIAFHFPFPVKKWCTRRIPEKSPDGNMIIRPIHIYLSTYTYLIYLIYILQDKQQQDYCIQCWKQGRQSTCTCFDIVWQLAADVTAAPARGVRGAHRLEVGWPQLRGRGGEDARLYLSKQQCTLSNGWVIGGFSNMFKIIRFEFLVKIYPIFDFVVFKNHLCTLKIVEVKNILETKLFFLWPLCNVICSLWV